MWSREGEVLLLGRGLTSLKTTSKVRVSLPPCCLLCQGWRATRVMSLPYRTTNGPVRLATNAETLRPRVCSASGLDAEATPLLAVSGSIRWFSFLYASWVCVTSVDRRTHNNLDVPVVQDRPSWTCYVGDGVFQLPSIRTNLKQREDASVLLPGQTGPTQAGARRRPG